MLTITDEAATLISTLTQEADLPDDSGLRISVDPVHHSLSMGLAAAPEHRDAVVEGQDGARVFLSPQVTHRLAGRTLLAEVSPRRSLFFLDR